MNQRTIVYILITITALILSYFLFSTSDSKRNNDKFSSSRTDSSGRNIQDGRSAVESEFNDKSLFDGESGFLDFSGVGNDDDRASGKKYDTAGLSPEERAKRRELVIEKYAELAKQFPKNRYIPRKYTPEEEEAIKERDANMNYLQERLLSNDELSPNERAYFYSNKLDETNEKLEILSFAVKKLTEVGSLPEESQKLIDERMASIQKRKNMYNQEVEAASKEGGSRDNF